VPQAARARASATLEGGTISFFADTLSVVARDRASLRLIDGTHVSGDAAYVDLKNDRAVLAGHARIEHGGTTVSADAIAVDLDANRVDLLDVGTGVSRTTRTLGSPVHAEIDAKRFAFPDVDDRYAFIRSRHAAITPRANVRFSPAAFPTSVGGVPVPSYLYTFATAAGFGQTTLPGATFDQPYGLIGTPTSLTSAHARWENNDGALALQEQLASGDTAYATGAIDAPFRGTGSSGFNAYQRLGTRYTFLVDGNAAFGSREGDATLGAAFGTAGGRLTYHLQNGGYSSFDASLRTPDLELVGGNTLRLTADVGYDAQRGGDLYPYVVLPGGRAYGTVCHARRQPHLVRLPAACRRRHRVGQRLEEAHPEFLPVCGLPEHLVLTSLSGRPIAVLSDPLRTALDARRDAILRLVRLHRRGGRALHEPRPAVRAADQQHVAASLGAAHRRLLSV
jgi:hypothetical protein